MGGRYYCEYCNKSFVNTPNAVKKHSKGLQHQRLRNEHYAQFEDKRKIFENESKKNPCKKFMESGQCIFGAACRFSHYDRFQLEKLKWEIDQAEHMKTIESHYDPCRNKSFEGWLADRRNKGTHNSNALEKMFVEKLVSGESDLAKLMSWNYPVELERIPNLPPSLKKINIHDFSNLNISEWG